MTTNGGGSGPGGVGSFGNINLASAGSVTVTAANGSVNMATTGNFDVQSAGIAGTMKGMTITNGSGTGVTSTAGASATIARFVGGTAVTGNKFEIICADGTNWMAVGTSGASSGVIFSP